jgi:hypothetical protein
MPTMVPCLLFAEIGEFEMSGLPELDMPQTERKLNSDLYLFFILSTVPSSPDLAGQVISCNLGGICNTSHVQQLCRHEMARC